MSKPKGLHSIQEPYSLHSAIRCSFVDWAKLFASIKIEVMITKTTSTVSQKQLLTFIQGWGWFTLTLHLAAAQLPADTTWSVWPYTFLPTWLGWLCALVAAATIFPPISQRLAHVMRPLWYFLLTRQGASRQRYFLLIACLSGGLFYLARLRHLRWGDGYLLTVILAHPDPTVRVIYNWQAPLTVLLHQRLWQFIADPFWGASVQAVYAAVSIACGLVFIYLWLNFMPQLGRDPLEAALLLGLTVTTGSVQLFFGYVENYTTISLGLLITMFLAWQTLRYNWQPFWPILSLSLTNGFHPSTVFLWPSMLWLVWRCYRRGQIAWADALIQTVMTPLLIGAAIFALMEMGGHGLSALTGIDQPGGGDAIWFVALKQSDILNPKLQHYTMFSPAHFMDWANLHFLISPFGLPLIVAILYSSYRHQITLFIDPTERDFASFLGVASFMYLLLTFMWNADYGMQKDWDLFAPSAFIYTLLMGFLLVRALPDRALLRQAGVFMIAVSALHTAAWIFANMQALSHD